MDTKNFHVHVLKREFDERQKRDPKFSLRAFARMIEVDPSAVSAIFKGKRSLPKKNAESVAQILQLDEKETYLFKESIFNKNKVMTPEDEAVEHAQLKSVYHDIKENARNYAIIAEWEHYAIISLMDLEDFQNDEMWIAERLGIDYQRAREVIKNLLQANIITVDPRNNVWHKNYERLNTTDMVPSKAIRASHEESMRMAIEKMHSLPIDERTMSSSTFCMDRTKIPMANKLIKEFRRKLIELMEAGKKTDVYQIQVQLFPLTEPGKEENFELKEAN